MRTKNLMIFLSAIIFLATTGIFAHAQEDIEELFALGKANIAADVILHDSMGTEYHLNYFGTMDQCEVFFGWLDYDQDGVADMHCIATWNAYWRELMITGLPNDSWYGSHLFGIVPNALFWTHNNAGGVTTPVTLRKGRATVAPAIPIAGFRNKR